MFTTCGPQGQNSPGGGSRAVRRLAINWDYAALRMIP
jgi:hypothetical protein